MTIFGKPATAASSLCIAILLFMMTPAQASEASTLDPLFTAPGIKLKKNSEPWPTDLAAAFSVQEPQPDENRSPASSKKKSKKPLRRSQLPASVQEGFELRVRYRELVSTFWVIKRSERHDLMYSNNEGSKSSIGLAPEQFRALQDAALAIKPMEGNLKSCPSGSMQMHIVRQNKPERTISGCVNDKSKSAEGLRNISNLLAASVR